LSRFKPNHKTTWVIVASALVAMLVAPFALASGEGRALLGGQRNPGTGSSQEYTRETEIIANTPTYGTRQSNKGSGGGAVYGCRSSAGGTPTGNEPCLRATNLSSGLAFEYSTTTGTLGGTIAVGNGGDTTKPFTTNATGVATGLNADRVDGKDATQLIDEASPWAKVAANGTLSAKRGAVSSSSHSAAGTYAVLFGSDVNGCAFNATASDGGAVVASFTVGPDKRTVNVSTYEIAPTPGAADHAFDLVASC
jgi:hypothetical protein